MDDDLDGFLVYPFYFWKETYFRGCVRYTLQGAGRLWDSFLTFLCFHLHVGLSSLGYPVFQSVVFGVFYVSY